MPPGLSPPPSAIHDSGGSPRWRREGRMRLCAHRCGGHNESDGVSWMEIATMCDRVCAFFLSSMLVSLPITEPLAVAQPSGAARRPSASGPGRSPEVGADRMATFRLRAPRAMEVVVAGQWSGEPAAMTKRDGDVWSVTVGPIAPGVWEYSFRVDGLQQGRFSAPTQRGIHFAAQGERHPARMASDRRQS